MTIVNGKDKETIIESKRKWILDRFRERGGKARKGLFTPTKRKRLLGEIPKGKREIKYKSQFRYEVREQVKTALIDFQLFIGMGDKDSVNDVITPEIIKPLVDVLLFSRIKETAEPNVNTVKIAQMFIHQGFQYLQRISKDNIGRLHEGAIGNALEICDILANLHLPFGERWEHPRD